MQYIGSYPERTLPFMTSKNVIYHEKHTFIFTIYLSTGNRLKYRELISLLNEEVPSLK